MLVDIEKACSMGDVKKRKGLKRNLEAWAAWSEFRIKIGQNGLDKNCKTWVHFPGSWKCPWTSLKVIEPSIDLAGLAEGSTSAWLLTRWHFNWRISIFRIFFCWNWTYGLQPSLGTSVKRVTPSLFLYSVHSLLSSMLLTRSSGLGISGLTTRRKDGSGSFDALDV